MPKTPRSTSDNRRAYVDQIVSVQLGCFKAMRLAEAAGLPWGTQEDWLQLSVEVGRLVEDAERIPRSERSPGRRTLVNGRPKGTLPRE
jgi:hypothetical protein